MAATMIELVIFDLDGLLVDSQPLQYKAYNRVFSDYGYPISREDWQTMVRQSYSIKRWIEENELPLDPELIRNQKKESYDRFIEEELQLKPGAKEAVELLSEKYRLCIASASRIESIEAVVKKFSLADYFRTFVSDNTVSRGKPFPDVFLEAASQMKTVPEQCIVIEDSVAGLRAAKEAGMLCIICPDSYIDTPLEQYRDADLIVDRLDDISISIIEELGATCQHTRTSNG